MKLAKTGYLGDYCVIAVKPQKSCVAQKNIPNLFARLTISGLFARLTWRFDF
jgi:hypothetical protein